MTTSGFELRQLPPLSESIWWAFFVELTPILPSSNLGEISGVGDEIKRGRKRGGD
jgi:hypothetical protein